MSLHYSTSSLTKIFSITQQLIVKIEPRFEEIIFMRQPLVGFEFPSRHDHVCKLQN